MTIFLRWDCSNIFPSGISPPAKLELPKIDVAHLVRDITFGNRSKSEPESETVSEFEIVRAVPENNVALLVSDITLGVALAAAES